MLKRVVLFMAAIVGWASFAVAQEAGVEEQRFRDWQVLRQVETGKCAISISVGLAQTNSGLATINIIKRQNDEGVPAVMTIKVPLGVSLRSGLAYSHSGTSETVGLAWQYCTPNTCLASGGISSAEIANLKKDREIFLAFQPLPNSRPIIVPVSLLGFTKAWRALQSCS